MSSYQIMRNTLLQLSESFTIEFLLYVNLQEFLFLPYTKSNGP